MLNTAQIETICAAAEVTFDFATPERELRAPILTVMGHVDHGKTTLIDALRHSDIAAGEYGEITQSIGAFSLVMGRGKYVTVIDTPGHEIFTEMRSRGVVATDMIVLVVSASEGVKRQTKEVIKLANSSKVPLIVAINKIDREDADVDQVMLELAENGVEVEALGGTVSSVCISAKTGENVSELLKALEEKLADIDLEESNKVRAQGFIIESELTKNKRAAEVASSVVLMRGTLTSESYFVCDQTMGKVRIMRDDTKNIVKKVGPGRAAHVLGFKEIPAPGSFLYAIDDERQARIILTMKRKLKNQMGEVVEAKEEDIEALKNTTMTEAVPIIIKASRAGILETLSRSISTQLDSNCIYVLSIGIGPITESDIKTMSEFGGVIFGFDVECRSDIAGLAAVQGVPVRIHRLMLQMIENLGNLQSEVKLRRGEACKNIVMGKAVVKQLFNLSGGKMIVGGSLVSSGSITKEKKCRVIRNGKKVADNLEIAGLKIRSEKVDEVREGLECGITFVEYNDLMVGDIIESCTQIKREHTFLFTPGVKHCD
eukprot:TRINITY_DN633_c0_g3_i1.p1 TRINITY_DN633_c0_g3~~TRINITY_DN633_c0_g3_i1.p1  ORF type:complete len:544 (+),score=185.43 TRINITY_DN633_c0_g3_i1:395-2026(+)